MTISQNDAYDAMTRIALRHAAASDTADLLAANEDTRDMSTAEADNLRSFYALRAAALLARKHNVSAEHFAVFAARIYEQAQ